jgi:hypothetical protein
MPLPGFVFGNPLETMGWTFLGLTGLAGLVALTSPRLFSKLAAGGSRWIDTARWLSRLDEPIDVDRFVLPYSRWLGAAVIASVAILGTVLAQG